MKDSKITLKIGREKYEVINISEIIMIKSDGNYITIEFINKKNKIIICKSLKTIIKEYDLNEFVKVRRGIIVNPNFILNFNGGLNPILTLQNGELLVPSRRCLNDLKRKIV